MSKRWIKAGSASQTIDIFVADSSSVVGAGLTGLVFNTTGLTCYYRKGATGTPTALTLATQTVGGAWSSGGFMAVDATNMPGVYRLDLSDTIVAAAGMVTVYLRGAANMVPVVLEIECVSVDIYSATAFITGINSLAPPTNWNLHSIDANGRVDVIKVAGTTQTARDLGTSVLLSSGSGSGQVLLSSGTITVGTNNDKTGYTASTVSDKTGYSLSAAGVLAIWNQLTTDAGIIASSFAKKLKDWVLGSDSKALLSTDAQTGVTIPTVTTLTNAPADSAGVTTLLARLGAFTGTGVNTVLGFLRGLLSKAAATPSDVGGTFDASTDSTEAIRDNQSSSSGGAGNVID